MKSNAEYYRKKNKAEIAAKNTFHYRKNKAAISSKQSTYYEANKDSQKKNNNYTLNNIISIVPMLEFHCKNQAVSVHLRTFCTTINPEQP
jgi:hypothetical protein